MREYAKESSEIYEISNSMEGGITNLHGALVNGSWLYWVVNWYYQSLELVSVFQDGEVLEIEEDELNKLITKNNRRNER